MLPPNKTGIVATIRPASNSPALLEAMVRAGLNVAWLRPVVFIPRHAWADQAAYDATATRPAGLFNKTFEAGATAEFKAAGPT